MAEQIYSIEPFGDNGVRVRIPVDGQIGLRPSLAPILTLNSSSESFKQPCGLNVVTSGNLEVTYVAEKRILQASRLSDSKLLLEMTGLKCTPSTFSRFGSMSCEVSFLSELGSKYYGLGEHRSGTIGYTRFFQEL